jgi:hypothetical protein
MELEPAPDFEFRPAADRRPVIPEPPPVRLVTVDDATLPASTGSEAALDAFYMKLLRFERDAKADGIVYRAENFRLRFELVEGPIARDHLRALGIEVPSLNATETELLVLGHDKLALLDPAGNWLELVEATRIG